MKIRTLALATALAITATGYAFAQNSSNPTEPAGSKATDTSSSGTMAKDKVAKDKVAKDKVAKDKVAKDKVAKDKMKSGTTGSGMAADEASGKTNGPKSNRSISPASPNAGEKQEK
jgi:pentapeptide MXKDX repeat protein